MKKIITGSGISVFILFISVLICLPGRATLAGGYNPTAAINYAHQYYSNYNPAYRNYNGSGGDCANFVSQCLHAGGLPEDSVWYNGSSAWIACTYQVNYFRNKGYKVIDYAQASDIKPGNPVYYYYGGSMAHTAICVGYDSNGKPLVAAHNKNHWNFDWTLGGAGYWGGSTRRVTILINEGGGSGGGGDCSCSDSYAGDYVVSTAGLPLIMRSGHGTNYSVITQIPNGTTVHVSRADGSWAHVEWNGYSGYSSMSYLSRVDDVKPPQLCAWFSDSPMGEGISDDKVKCCDRYYLCYELTDPDTGKKFTHDCNYTVKETIYRPEGTELFSYSYDKSPDNWISAVLNGNGEFKGVVEITGDYIGSVTTTITTPDTSRLRMHAWFSKTRMGSEVTELEKGEYYYLCYSLEHFDTKKKLNELIVMNYQVKEEVKGPGGSTVYSYSYTNSDSNWIGFTASETGTYKGFAYMTGDYTYTMKASAECKEKTIAVTGVKLNNSTLNMVEGDEKTLTATVSPGNATNKNVTWKSSDNKVATVKNGVVKAVGAGTATITVTSTDGSKTAACKVTVFPKTVNVSSVSLSKNNISLSVGNNYMLTAKILPANATDKSTKWKSSNTNVATVKDGIVTAIGAGSTVISVETTDGSKKAECTVNVTTPDIREEDKSDDKAKADFIVSNVSASAGSEVTVDISIKNNPGITALKAMLVYNKDVLSLINVEYPELFSSRATGGEKYNSPFAITWYSAASKNENANGVFARATFKVNEKAETGSYSIKLNCDADNIINNKGDNIGFKIINGEIKITDKVISGDVNGDKQLNMKDIVILQQKLNDWDVTIDEAAADVNKDGKVNMKDIVLLQQYLNGKGELL